MVSTILLVFFSLIGLILLHELGHFVLAKKFGVKVEEFGLFLPPRVWGKKIGETIYSINWIPAGAFVKLLGEESADSDTRSFTTKPIWQRMLIIAGGVISFWLVAIVILSVVSMVGAMQSVDDNDSVANAQVQIIEVQTDSPAATAGLKTQDIIQKASLKSDPTQSAQIDKVNTIQEFTTVHKGQEIVLTVLRGDSIFETTITPRANPPAGQGAMGLGLLRVAKVTYPWWQALGKGITATWNMTTGVFEGWGMIIGRLVKNEGLPAGAQLVGPIGIAQLMGQEARMGISYYLQFIAMISVYLAVFNALPIPALDGGKLFFLLIEAIRRRPVPEKWEQGLTAFFFFALLALMAVISIGDVQRLF